MTEILNFRHRFKLKDWINKSKLDWNGLCRNPAAIQLLEENPKKINWNFLSLNPAAIHLLEKNKDKIYRNFLCANPAAIHLIKEGTIDPFYISLNPSAVRHLRCHGRR